jgi:hypothetical protein
VRSLCVVSDLCHHLLYEETPGDPPWRRATGSVVWSTEMVWDGTGKAAEPAVRANVDIPERMHDRA